MNCSVAPMANGLVSWMRAPRTERSTTFASASPSVAGRAVMMKNRGTVRKSVAMFFSSSNSRRKTVNKLGGDCGGKSARRFAKRLKLPPQRVQIDPRLVAHAQPVNRPSQPLLFVDDPDAGLEARGRRSNAPGDGAEDLDRTRFSVDLESE